MLAITLRWRVIYDASSRANFFYEGSRVAHQETGTCFNIDKTHAALAGGAAGGAGPILCDGAFERVHNRLWVQTDLSGGRADDVAERGLAA